MFFAALLSNSPTPALPHYTHCTTFSQLRRNLVKSGRSPALFPAFYPFHSRILHSRFLPIAAVAESGRQTIEPPNSQRNFTWGGGIYRSSVSQIIHKVQVLQEKVHLTADWSAQHARVIFGMQFERQCDNK